MPYDDLLDESEYPSDRDIERFGDDSPPDDDPLTIGYVAGVNDGFWTGRRLMLVIGGLLLVGALLLPVVLRFL